MDDSEPENRQEMMEAQRESDTADSIFGKKKKPIQETGGATGGVTVSIGPSGADVYNLEYPRKGVALIIANSKFKKSLERKGATVDTGRIYQTVKKLGLEPLKYENKKAAEIRDLIEKVSRKDHSDAAMFVCIITSHGVRNGILGTDERHVNVKELAGYFKGDKCQSLAGKPKLFFIQACRGTNADPGVRVEQPDCAPYEDQEPTKAKKMICTIPTSADFLMSYSTVSDYLAYLNPSKGSYYMQALADELEKCNGYTEISRILQRVTCQLAFTFTSKTDDKSKQCPVYTSTLTKQLFLDAHQK